MTFTEALIERSIVLNTDFGPWYGSDQMFITYPIRFATVEFGLIDTDSLVQIADKIRADAGYRPIYPVGDFTDEDCDQNCWYEFYIGINDLPNIKCDTAISFVVANSRQDDNESTYLIDLTPEEQTAIYNILDKECQKEFGKTCEEFLAEAKTEMES